MFALNYVNQLYNARQKLPDKTWQCGHVIDSDSIIYFPGDDERRRGDIALGTTTHMQTAGSVPRLSALPAAVPTWWAETELERCLPSTSATPFHIASLPTE